jgi:hypothetical protein
MSEYALQLTESISPQPAEGEEGFSIENLIKARYTLNPVYRTLLKTDIDAFLARQPSNYNLAANQEYNLAKKRQLLENYYNWLRYYAPFENELEELYEIPQTKSFVDSVYHQQFKGTLQIARRLFSVTFAQDLTPNTSQRNTSLSNKKQRRVLSYDQTLYADTKVGDEELAVDDNPFLHEQLLSVPLPHKGLSSHAVTTTKDLALPLREGSDADAQTRAESVQLSQARGPVNSKSLSDSTRVSPSTGEPFAPGSSSARVLGYEDEQGKENKMKSITTFEDLESFEDEEGIEDNSDSDVEVVEPPSKEFELSISPFIEESNSSPIYAGWDDTLRQFVVTNKFNFK